MAKLKDFMFVEMPKANTVLALSVYNQPAKATGFEPPPSAREFYSLLLYSPSW